MSGGSFDYLFAKTAGDVIDRVDDLAVMGELLRELDENAMADELNELVVAIDAISTRIDRYRELMRCIEWWQSCDYGPDQVIEHIHKMQAEAP